MAYELLIEFEISYKSPLKKFLKPNEVVRCEPVDITMFMTNLGREIFPGGKIHNWNITYGEEQRISYTSSKANNVDCSRLAPNERVRLLSEEVIFVTDGIAWIWCKVDPKGEGKEVKYYQAIGEALAREEWTNCLYVVNREMLLLLSAIEKLTKQLR